MADDLTTQGTAPSTPPSGTIFRALSDGTRDWIPSPIAFALNATNPWQFQLVSSGVGLPVQLQSGSITSLLGGFSVSGNLIGVTSGTTLPTSPVSGAIIAITSGGVIPVQLLSGSIVSIASGSVQIASGSVQVTSGGVIPVQLQSGAVVSVASGAVQVLSGSVQVTSGTTLPVVPISGTTFAVVSGGIIPVWCASGSVAVSSGGTIPVQLLSGAIVSVASGAVQVLSGSVQVTSGGVIPTYLTSGSVAVTSGTTLPVTPVSGSILQVYGLAPAGNPVSGNPVPIGIKDFSGNVQVARGTIAGDQFTLPPNLQTAPILLFDGTASANQAGPTQTGLIFPSSGLSGVFPAVGTGNVNTLTCSGNPCGAIFSSRPEWDSVLLDVVAGGLSGTTVAFEIGRLNTSGVVAQVMSSGIMTGSTLFVGPTTVNPLTGAAHASTSWRYFDAVTLTNRAQLGEVLVDVGGTAGGGPMQLRVAVHDCQYYYFMATGINVNFSGIMAAITPIS